MSSFMTNRISFRFTEAAVDQMLYDHVKKQCVQPIQAIWNLGLAGILTTAAAPIIHPMRTFQKLCSGCSRICETALSFIGERRMPRNPNIDKPFIFLTWKMIARKLQLSEEEANMNQIEQIDQWVASHPEKMEEITELNFTIKDAPLYLPALQRFPLPNLETLSYSGTYHIGHLYGVESFADNWPRFKTLSLSHVGISQKGMLEVQGTDLHFVSSLQHKVVRMNFNDTQKFKASVREMFKQCIKETGQLLRFQECPERPLNDLFKARIIKTVREKAFEFGEAAVLYAFTMLSFWYLKKSFMG